MRHQPSIPFLRSPRNARGSILVTIFIFSIGIIVVSTALIGTVRQMANTARRRAAGNAAFYAAESGIARTLALISATYQRGQLSGTEFDTVEARPYYPFGGADSPQAVDVNRGNAAATASDTESFVVRCFTVDDGGKKYVIESTGRSTQGPENTYRRINITIAPRSFSRYAFFNTASLSTIDGDPRWLAPGEVFWGPVHSNRYLYVYGSSTDHLQFRSDVTMVNQEIYGSGGTSYVDFYGLRERNAGYVELPTELTELEAAAASGGINLLGGTNPGDPNDDDPTAVAFFADNPSETVDPIQQIPFNDGAGSISNYEFAFNNNVVTITNLNRLRGLQANPTYAPVVAANPNWYSWNVNLSSINGAIVVDGGNAFVHGVLDGKVTIAALAADSRIGGGPIPHNQRSDGNVIVNGELVYAGHPDDQKYIENPDLGDCDDVLGLIAENNFALDADCPANTILDAHIMVTGQASQNPDVRTWPSTTDQTINQAIGQDGAFFMEDGNNSSSDIVYDLSQWWSGLNDLTGDDSTQSAKDGRLYLTGGVVHFLRGQTANDAGGYDRHYSFDQRLHYMPPPYYPLAGGTFISEWREDRHAGGDDFAWQ
jgi:hypothetical protein